MFYIDLKQTNDVLLTFEALKVQFLKILGDGTFYRHGGCSCVFWCVASLGFYYLGLSLVRRVNTGTNEKFSPPPFFNILIVQV